MIRRTACFCVPPLPLFLWPCFGALTVGGQSPRSTVHVKCITVSPICCCKQIHTSFSTDLGQIEKVNSSQICGNKMPTRCNRGFHCRSYCFLNMFRAPLCPSSGAQEYYTVVAACGVWCCGFQVVGLVWSWGLCVQTWKPRHQISQVATTV